jgi:ubiquinone/menaquinone biosynthesis C-methylase UbiE
MMTADCTPRRCPLDFATARRKSESVVANEDIPEGDNRSRVVGYFGRLAKSYGEGEYYARRRAAVVKALAPELARSRDTLDLGCGNGAYLKNFRDARKSMRLVGADLSFEMLAEARRRVGKSVRFVRADASTPPFRDESFDFIFCSHVLPFVEDLDRSVRDIARCLRTSGVLVATMEDSFVREELRTILPAERWEEFARSVFAGASGRRRRHVADEAYRSAYERAGLAVEMRAGHFEIEWPHIEEWVRIRWIPVATDEQRAQIDRVLSEMRADERLASRKFDLVERVLIGRKA